MNLSNTQLFQGLQEQEITLLLDCLNAVKRSYKKGETILSEGNITENIGIVLSGMVIISCNDIWGNNSVLGNVSTGSVFAEAYACIPGQAMLVTVSAIEDTEILFLNVGRVFTICSNTCFYKKTYQKFIRHICTQKHSAFAKDSTYQFKIYPR